MVYTHMFAIVPTKNFSIRYLCGSTFIVHPPLRHRRATRNTMPLTFQ